MAVWCPALFITDQRSLVNGATTAKSEKQNRPLPRKISDLAGAIGGFERRSKVPLDFLHTDTKQVQEANAFKIRYLRLYG